MAEFERIEKVSYLRIFTHNINKRKFMISCCDHLSIKNGVLVPRGTPIYGLYRYVPRERVWFLRFSILK